MKKVVIFGVRDFAELAHYYISNDTKDEVIAFTVDSKFLGEEREFKGLPIVPFEQLEEIYPPAEFVFFAPMSGAQLNKLREKVYHTAKQKGYECYSYISSHATVLTDVIGDNCFILEDNTIQPFVEIGNNVVLWSGNHIGHHSRIGDHVLFTSHVVLSGHCEVADNAWFGVNATVRDQCKIGQGAFIAMSSSVTKDVLDWTGVRGVPAKEFGDSRKLKV